MSIEADWEVDGTGGVTRVATSRATSRTGVSMTAGTGAVESQAARLPGIGGTFSSCLAIVVAVRGAPLMTRMVL